MSAHAEQVYPEECCGLMLGKIYRPDENSSGVNQPETSSHSIVTAEMTADEPYKVLKQLVALENHWTTPAKDTPYTKRRRYTIDPKDMLRVQKQARAQGLNIIGVYHSHPDHVAEPSECDRAQAWPDYAYVIVSVQGHQNEAHEHESKENANKAVDIQNWTLDSEHQFRSEAMKISPTSATDRMPVPA